MLRRLAKATRLLLIVAGLLPFLPLLFAKLPGLGGVGEFIEGWFAFQCHREPERSLFLTSRTFPVCARCLGIYLGLGLGAAVGRPRLRPVLLRLVVGFALVVMVLDVLTELLAMRPESALVRLSTGLLLSWPISAQLVWVAKRHLLDGEVATEHASAK